MARYTGAVEKLQRRLNTDLELKGERKLNGKSSLDKRPYAPGQHGQRRSKLSEYGMQLQEKQKAKIFYGLSEKQFRNYFKEASRRDGNTGANLITLIEQRLDNVVYRMGYATTRASARQFVVHGHILVDGKKVDIPSYILKEGQRVEVKEKSKTNKQIVSAIEFSKQSGCADWLDVDTNKLHGVFVRIPSRDEVSIPIEERLIVELYSK